MQAPIGSAATTELVAAVSGCGALGTLAASWTPPAVLREQVSWLRSTCTAPFCVNLVLAFEQRERLAAILDEGGTVVSFSWGLDAELVSKARDAGAYVLVQVATLADAHGAVGAGADALIVQGVEAGGHVQATRPLLELLREIRPAVDVPLLAAGGIADATSRGDAREAGADAVACGTAFLAAEEANVHPIYLDHIMRAGAAQTTLTTVFDRGWSDAPHRVIRNETLAAWEAAGKPERGRRPGDGDHIASRNGRPVLRYDFVLPTRDTVGDISAMAMYAGTSVQAIDRGEPAKHIVERITRGL